MKLDNQINLRVSKSQAWDALNDTDMLQSAIPGCELITKTGDDLYEVALTAAIGPVRAKFKGQLALADVNPPDSYTLNFVGKGGAAGHGSGSVRVRLEALSDRETLLHYFAEASIGGKIAQVGSRLVDSAAQKMASEFFEKFSAALATRYDLSPPPVSEPNPEISSDSIWRTFLAWLRTKWSRA